MFELDLLAPGAQARRYRHDSGMADAGDGAQAGQQLIVESLARVGVLVARIGQIDAPGHQLLRRNPGIDGEIVEQAVDKDTGSGEEHEREGELRHDKHRGEPSFAMMTHAARAFLENLVDIGPGRAEGRHYAEEKAADDAQRGKVAEHRVVHGEVNPGGPHALRGKVEPVHAECGQAHSEQAAESAEQHALDQQLADYPPAGSTQGGADGHLAPAEQCPAQHHVGHVGAGDDENKSHRGQHEQEDYADAAAVIALMKGLNGGGNVLVDSGILLRKTAGNAVQFTRSLLQADAALEDAVRRDAAIVALGKLGRGRQRHVDIDAGGEFEAHGHDAHDGGGLAVDAHMAADHVPRTAVAVLPHAVAEDQHGRGAGLVVGGHKRAPQDGPGVQHGEDAGRGAQQMIALRGKVVLADDAAVILPALEGFEGGRLRAKIL